MLMALQLPSYMGTQGNTSSRLILLMVTMVVLRMPVWKFHSTRIR